VTFSLTAAALDVILLDIEGTTTPIEFVHRTLFSYARERIHAFLEASASDSAVRAALDGLRDEWRADAAAGESPPEWRDDSSDARLTSAASYVRWLIDRDRKSRWLKELQGRIWEEGYRSGSLRGEVYPDVPPALSRWTGAGLQVGIFSSGSVLAQKLLFAHSNAGDLTPFLRWHFDTAVGPKREPASYHRIAHTIGVPPDRILFISDVAGEIEAAEAAGLRMVLCDRQGAGANGQSSRHPVIRTFDRVLA
jgi:enolase-phosphatase E1